MNYKIDIKHRSDSCPNLHIALMMIEAGWGSEENLPEDDLSLLKGRVKREFDQLYYLFHIRQTEDQIPSESARNLFQNVVSNIKSELIRSTKSICHGNYCCI